MNYNKSDSADEQTSLNAGSDPAFDAEDSDTSDEDDEDAFSPEKVLQWRLAESSLHLVRAPRALQSDCSTRQQTGLHSWASSPDRCTGRGMSVVFWSAWPMLSDHPLPRLLCQLHVSAERIVEWHSCENHQAPATQGEGACLQPRKRQRPSMADAGQSHRVPALPGATPAELLAARVEAESGNGTAMTAATAGGALPAGDNHLIKPRQPRSDEHKFNSIEGERKGSNQVDWKDGGSCMDRSKLFRYLEQAYLQCQCCAQGSTVSSVNKCVPEDPESTHNLSPWA